MQITKNDSLIQNGRLPVGFRSCHQEAFLIHMRTEFHTCTVSEFSPRAAFWGGASEIIQLMSLSAC